MSVESALTFFLAIFIFGITPGPGIFAILARAMVDGARSCTLLAFGMVISDIVYLVLACFGLATIAENWGELFTVIRFVGAGYLLYLGYKMFTAPVNVDTQTRERSDLKGSGAIASFIQGFLISASNPKVILFYIAFLPTFMDLTVLNSTDIVVAAALTLVALMLGLMLVALSAARAARLLRTPQAVQRLNRGAGSIMMGAGLYLAGSK
ncbi:MAG: LysE family translocator [Marinobacterium sp.]|nr:LysE family translocator [Marinobacterium sp.]